MDLRRQASFIKQNDLHIWRHKIVYFSVAKTGGGGGGGMGRGEKKKKESLEIDRVWDVNLGLIH